MIRGERLAGTRRAAQHDQEKVEQVGQRDGRGADAGLINQDKRCTSSARASYTKGGERRERIGEVSHVGRGGGGRSLLEG